MLNKQKTARKARKTKQAKEYLKRSKALYAEALHGKQLDPTFGVVEKIDGIWKTIYTNDSEEERDTFFKGEVERTMNVRRVNF